MRQRILCPQSLAVAGGTISAPKQPLLFIAMGRYFSKYSTAKLTPLLTVMNIPSQN